MKYITWVYITRGSVREECYFETNDFSDAFSFGQKMFEYFSKKNKGEHITIEITNRKNNNWGGHWPRDSEEKK